MFQIASRDARFCHQHDAAIHRFSLRGVRRGRIAVGEPAEPSGEDAPILERNLAVVADGRDLNQIAVAQVRRLHIRPDQQPVAHREGNLVRSADFKPAGLPGVHPLLAILRVTQHQLAALLPNHGGRIEFAEAPP